MRERGTYADYDTRMAIEGLIIQDYSLPEIASMLEISLAEAKRIYYADFSLIFDLHIQCVELTLRETTKEAVNKADN